MLTVKPDKPVSPDLLMLVRALDRVTKQLQIPYFVIGATARDLLIEHVYGLETTRATRDIDFAVAVSSWENFARLKEQLIATGAFQAGEQSHRLAARNGDPQDPRMERQAGARQACGRCPAAPAALSSDRPT